MASHQGDGEGTETDFWPFSRRKRGKEIPVVDEQDTSVQIAPNPGTNQDDEEYFMGHPSRGLALIFNHSEFQDTGSRRGSDSDRDALAPALQDLGFEVRVHNDLRRDDLQTILEKASNEDHTDADCLVVAVMTHGFPGYLCARDGPYAAQVLWENFTGDNCLSLVGKPKIFLIQACRGTKVDAGVKVRIQTDSAGGHYTIPTQCDILIAYSTVEGHYSWRNPREGSWFIQSLVKELQLNGTTRDLQTILTFVCRRVALEKQSFVPEKQSSVPRKPDMDKKKQSPTFTSSLTRLVYFR